MEGEVRVYMGGCFHIGDVCGNGFRSSCVFVCVSSCGCTGVSDVAGSCAWGLGLVNPCPRLPAPHLRPLWVLARARGLLAHPRALDGHYGGRCVCAVGWDS